MDGVEEEDEEGRRGCRYARYRRSLEKGSSRLSGDYVVEDVCTGKLFLRRLIFLSSQNLIQSEAILLPPQSGDDLQRQLELNLEQLACDHHRSMIPAVSLGLFDSSFVAETTPLSEMEFNFCVVGLGGGSLATYLHSHFPKVMKPKFYSFLFLLKFQARVVGVELDGSIAQVASKWFGYKEDNRSILIVEDGVSYLKDMKRKRNEGSFNKTRCLTVSTKLTN